MEEKYYFNMGKNPLYIDVASRIALYIRENNLFPGSQLPGGRKLSKILGVSKNTIFDAISYLQNEGLVEVHHSSGCYVTENIWKVEQEQWERFTNYTYNKPASNILQKVAIEQLDDELSITGAVLDKSFGYLEIISKAMDDVSRELPISDNLINSNVFGVKAAREAVNAHLQTKGITANINQIVLMPSVDDAIDIVIKALTSGHSRCVIYAEYYMAAMLKVMLSVYNNNRIEIKILPTDEEGISINAVRSIVMGNTSTRFILFINVTRQHLYHRCMSNRRIKEVSKVCRDFKLPVVEIEYYGDLTPSIKPLKSFDKEGHVIYIGMLVPYAQTGLGGAWIVSPDYVIPKILDISVTSRNEPPALTYLLIEKLLSKGYYAEFISELQIKILQRIKLTNIMLDKYLTEYADWEPDPGYGVYWLKMKPHVNVKAMFENRKGIKFMLGSYLDPADKAHIGLCSCRLSEGDLERALLMLKQLASQNLYKK